MKFSAFLLAGAMLICLSMVSCDKKATAPARSVIYFNSFESAQDTTGWSGITDAMFVSDPAPKGGKQSLHIGGGCLQPAAHINLPAQTRESYYRVSCWGKVADISQGGSIGLAVGEQRREIRLIIRDEEWTFYESEESLRCPANRNMRLEIYIGGYAPASMLVDCIKVEKVK